MSDTRKRQLLVLLAILLLLKFVGQPVLEWQADKLTQLQLAEKRVLRGQQAVSNTDNYEQRLQALNEQLEDTQSKVFEAMPDTAFRLEQQSWIENQLAKYNLQADSISWSPQVTLPGGFVQHRMELTLIGDVDDILRFHQFIEQASDKWVHFLTYNWVINRHLEFRVGAIRGSGTLAFYMESGERS